MILNIRACLCIWNIHIRFKQEVIILDVLKMKTVQIVKFVPWSVENTETTNDKSNKEEDKKEPLNDMNFMDSNKTNFSIKDISQFYESASSTIKQLDESIEKLKKSLDDSSTPFFKRALYKYQLAEMEFKRNKVIEVVKTVKGLGTEEDSDVLKELNSLIASNVTHVDESKKKEDGEKSGENENNASTTNKDDQPKKEGEEKEKEKEKEKSDDKSDQEKKIEELIEKIKKDPVRLFIL